MKKIILMTSCVFVFATMQAQITIDQNDMPNANDSTVRVTANNSAGLDFLATGANFTWDFSALAFTASSTDKYFAIANAPLLGLLTYGPFAPLNLKSQIFKDGQSPLNFGTGGASALFNADSTFEYYKKTASKYARTGYTIRLNGFDLPLPYDSNEVFFNLPMNYNNSDSGIIEQGKKE
jgi:hypothetical protein